jgi:hypothetical protein
MENSIKEKLIKLYNQVINKKNLSISQNIFNDWNHVEECFFETLKKYESINYIILGEATVNYQNYFYNPNSSQTSFLNPSHFNKNSKSDLIEFLIENGILIFDLYPIPLPTFIYDNIKFNFKEEDEEYKTILGQHFKPLKDKIKNDKPELIIRYSKIEKRPEYAYFIEYFKEKFTSISDISKDINADPIKISSKFDHLF